VNHHNPPYYEIRIAGQLGASLSRNFDGLTVRYVAQDTILSGPIVDQAALYGILLQLRDLGLSLISVSSDVGQIH
jgi:hypothetical protein